jgi:hypothetical protein
MSAGGVALVGDNEATAPEDEGVANTALLWAGAPGDVTSTELDPVPCVGVLGVSTNADTGAGAGVGIDAGDSVGMAAAESNLGGGAGVGADTSLGPAPGVMPPSGVGADTSLGGGTGAVIGAGVGAGGSGIFGGLGGKIGGVGPVPGGTPTGSVVLTGGATWAGGLAPGPG